MPFTAKANTLTNKNEMDSSNASPNSIQRAKYSSQPVNDVNAPVAHNAKLYFGLSALHWLYLCAFCAATLITWVASQNITQFKYLGPAAFQGGFPGDLDQWARRGGWENIIFEQDSVSVNRTVDKSSYAFRTFTLPPSANRANEKLLINGSINTITKKPPSDASDGGALMVWLQDDSDKVVKYMNIGKLDGHSDNYDVSRIVNLSNNLTRFSLVLTNKQTSAEFALTDASIMLITEQPEFVKIRMAVFLAWSVMLLIALYYLFIHSSKKMFAVIASVISLTIVGILMPENVASGTVKPVYTALQNLTGLTGDTLLEYAYKVGHFIFFFLSSFILLLYRKQLKMPAWEIYVLVVLFAIATEGLQLYLSDRSTRISDLLIDCSAIAIGAMLATIVTSLKPSTADNTPPTATQ